TGLLPAWGFLGIAPTTRPIAGTAVIGSGGCVGAEGVAFLDRGHRPGLVGPPRGTQRLTRTPGARAVSRVERPRTRGAGVANTAGVAAGLTGPRAVSPRFVRHPVHTSRLPHRARPARHPGSGDVALAARDRPPRFRPTNGARPHPYGLPAPVVDVLPHPEDGSGDRHRTFHLR